MHPSKLFEKPLFVNQAQQGPITLEGEFDPYVPSEHYEGRISIVGSIGICVVDLLEGDLPKGHSVYVDNETKEVVVTWPAYSPPRPAEEGIRNWNFELGTLAGWNDLRGNSWSTYVYDQHTPGAKDNPYMPPDGNIAAKMEGVGRGEHILESDKYDVVPGLPISARSLWYQGASNKDNNNLWTAIQFYTPGGVPLVGGEVRGDRIHDRTNKRRHWSSVNTVVPAGAGKATVRLIAHRRNGRNRLINVDDVETTGFSYIDETGWAGNTEFPITIKVRDSAGREVVGEYVILPVAGKKLVGMVHFSSPEYQRVYSTEDFSTWTEESRDDSGTKPNVNNGPLFTVGGVLLARAGDDVYRFPYSNIADREYVLTLGSMSRIKMFPDGGVYLASNSGLARAYIRPDGSAVTGSGSWRLTDVDRLPSGRWVSRHQSGSTYATLYSDSEEFPIDDASWVSAGQGNIGDSTTNQRRILARCGDEVFYLANSRSPPGIYATSTGTSFALVSTLAGATGPVCAIAGWDDGVLCVATTDGFVAVSLDYGRSFTTSNLTWGGSGGTNAGTITRSEDTLLFCPAGTVGVTGYISNNFGVSWDPLTRPPGVTGTPSAVFADQLI